MRYVVVASVISIAVLSLSACGTNQSDSSNNVQKNEMNKTELPVVMEAPASENPVDVENAKNGVEEQSSISDESAGGSLNANNEMVKDTGQQNIETDKSDEAQKDDVAKQKQEVSPDSKS